MKIDLASRVLTSLFLIFLLRAMSIGSEFISPKRPQHLLLLSQYYLEHENPEQSQTILNGIRLMKGSEQQAVHIALMQSAILEQQMQLQKALSSIEKINNDEALYRKSLLLFSTAESFAAVRHLHQIQEKFPHSKLIAPSQLLLAAVYISMNEYSSAQAMLDKVSTVKLDAELTTVEHYLLGVTAYKSNNLVEARQKFSKLSANENDTARYSATALSGISALKVNDEQIAEKALSDSMKTSPLTTAEPLGFALILNDLQKNKMGDAIATCEFLLQKSSDNFSRARLMTVRGVIYQRSGQTQLAIQDFKSVVAINDSQWSPKALILLGTTLWLANDTDVLMSDYQALIQKSHFQKTDLAACQLFVAQAYLSMNRFEDAESLYQDILKQSLPSVLTSQVVSGLVNTLTALRKFDEAEAKLDELMVRFGEDRPVIRFGMLARADLRWNRGDYAAAQTAYDKYVDFFKDDENTPRALYMSGRSFEKLQKWAEASVAWQTCRKKYPNSPYAFQSLVRQTRAATKQNNSKEAQQLYSQLMVSQNSKAAELALAQIGYTAAASNKPEAAIPYLDELMIRYPLSSQKPQAEQSIKLAYEKVAKSNPKALTTLAMQYSTADHGGEAYYWMALREFEKGNAEQGLPLFKKVVTEYPRTPSALEALFYKGQSEYQLRSYQEAYVTLGQFLKSNPDHDLSILANMQRARCSVQLGFLDEAIESYKRIVAQAPQTDFASEAAYQWGNLLVQQGKEKEVVQHFDQYVLDYPASSHTNEIYWRLGTLKKREGRYSLALAYLKKVAPENGVVTEAELSEVVSSLENLVKASEKSQ